MIRTVQRLGVVQAGDGGTAGAYSFDETGLSSDTRLAYYLQSLTPAQLQAALDGGSPGSELARLLNEDATGTGSGWLPCGTGANDPNCDSNATGPYAPKFSLGKVPGWAWLAAGGGVAALLLIRR